MQDIAKKNSVVAAGPKKYKQTFLTRLKKDFTKNKGLYLLVLPVLVYYLVFKYGPMFGVLSHLKIYSERFLKVTGRVKHFKVFFH